MALPAVTKIDDPFAVEEEEFTDPAGGTHRLRLVIGQPQIYTHSPFEIWYCPCAVGVDEDVEFNRFAGPGKVAAMINACKFLEARRAELIDEPALKRISHDDGS